MHTSPPTHPLAAGGVTLQRAGGACLRGRHRAAQEPAQADQEDDGGARGAAPFALTSVRPDPQDPTPRVTRGGPRRRDDKPPAFHVLLDRRPRRFRNALPKHAAPCSVQSVDCCDHLSSWGHAWLAALQRGSQTSCLRRRCSMRAAAATLGALQHARQRAGLHLQ